MRSLRLLCISLLAILLAPALRADVLDDLARDFWAWRAAELPVSTDDIPRLDRPAGWVPDWSPAAVESYRKQVSDFDRRWNAIDASSWPVPRQVDYRLIGSAIARAHWELEISRGWQRNPSFYLDQTLGAYFHLLLQPPPFSPERDANIVATLNATPKILEHARKNLKEPVRPFAELSLEQLNDVRPRLLTSVRELKPLLDATSQKQIDAAAESAVQALESYREWLSGKLSSMSSQTAIGPAGYVYFLKNVALLPYSPHQLLDIGRNEWARSVAFQTYEEHRNQGAASLPMPASMEAEIARERQDEGAVRQYLQEKHILSVPSWLHHYTWQPMPPYLKPLEGAAEADDFTSPSRLKENCIRYIDPPGPNLGYFASAGAKDPRTGIVHEGVPGHYFQLALSWAHPDPIRRYYYDSGANEGIGFYAEEMLLEAGLFDNSPRSREIIYNMVRLRALRVEVDVKLALGKFTIAQAADYLQETVPMDSRTAHAEAAFFASSPGQAISYQIGKTQILRFLAEARRQQGDKFDLQAFHDFLWLNGNVPIALQRWEYLGLKDDLETLAGMKVK
ncbi:MAG: DUF885 domain-containing protein [Acidobacteriales bacterium]|nr:DUF885 domain-containing protein [Terriglobales bacterium]